MSHYFQKKSDATVCDDVQPRNAKQTAMSDVQPGELWRPWGTTLASRMSTPAV